MRVTTNMLMRNYQTALMSQINGLSGKRNAILSGRKFSYASEDPGAAVTSSVLERRLLRTESFLDTIEEVQSRQDEQENAIMQMNRICQDIAKNYSMASLNDPTGQDGRTTYGVTLKGRVTEMVSSLNAQYGDEFVFGGNRGLQIPFEMVGDKLCYRGIPVTKGEELADGTYDMSKLEEYAKETNYVDLGFGLDFESRTSQNGSVYDDQVISSSAFNMCLPGINVVGYGEDADGMSNNLVDLINEMADLLLTDDFDDAYIDPETQDTVPPTLPTDDENLHRKTNREKYEELWMKFTEEAKKLPDKSAQLGTQTNLLDATKTRLTDAELSIKEQIDTIVNVDPAEAIMDFSWADYTYNTALKIGTHILSNSLLDFLR